ncbi:sigma-70 family RNA polymerase sigma factor [Humisphaera borealis]|uniref:Sigma-70 family RNA polymerase sigma factor n=1 Tax=Humisphaera borealis TaxID=2807512 RepID=A0A7M2WVX2_9BACT|nr:sigma-70 family RNA polymerase sigma factor [Humisphaera borealis]QOV89563.1 sigma-70 family RNA polymerase sigma factor [Humisphaera borealis]
MDDDRHQQVLQLFVRHQTRIRGFIVSLMGDFTAAADVVQETFLVVQQKAAEFDVNSNFLAWAFQIARFQVMKAQANRSRAADRFSNAVLESLSASAPAEPFDNSRLAVLPHCLAKLAPQARRIINLFYQHEHKPQAIARILDWTPAAVSVALSRARRLLRDCIEQQTRGQMS